MTSVEVLPSAGALTGGEGTGSRSTIAVDILGLYPKTTKVDAQWRLVQHHIGFAILETATENHSHHQQSAID
jgi:hypothetical protein